MVPSPGLSGGCHAFLKAENQKWPRNSGEGRQTGSLLPLSKTTFRLWQKGREINSPNPLPRAPQCDTAQMEDECRKHLVRSQGQSRSVPRQGPEAGVARDAGRSWLSVPRGPADPPPPPLPGSPKSHVIQTHPARRRGAARGEGIGVRRARLRSLFAGELQPAAATEAGGTARTGRFVN